MVCLCSCSKAAQVHTDTCSVFFLSALHIAQPSVVPLIWDMPVFISSNLFSQCFPCLALILLPLQQSLWSITTNVSNQAFSWTVEIKARDTHQPLSKYQSLCLGALSFQISMSFVSMSFQISRFCWMSGHSTEEGYKCILLQYNSLVGKILKKQTIEMWVVSLY